MAPILQRLRGALSFHQMINLVDAQEFGAGGRMDGNIGPTVGPVAIWNGHPPSLTSWDFRATPRMLSLALRFDDGYVVQAADVNSVRLQAVVGNGMGGELRRIFDVGTGVSAEIGMGSFRIARIFTMTDIPPNTKLYFVWSDDLPGATGTNPRLLNFLNYTVAGSVAVAPEGAILLTAENACQITYLQTAFGTTTIQAVAAGQTVPLQWGTFTCNVANHFTFQLRSF